MTGLMKGRQPNLTGEAGVLPDGVEYRAGSRSNAIVSDAMGKGFMPGHQLTTRASKSADIFLKFRNEDLYALILR